MHNLNPFQANCMEAFRGYTDDLSILEEADAMFLNNVSADKFGAERAAIAWIKTSPNLLKMLAFTNLLDEDKNNEARARLEVYQFCRDRLIAMYVRKRGHARLTAQGK